MAFEDVAKIEFQEAELLHADETSVSVSGKNWWYHLLASSVFVMFFSRKKGEKEAVNDLGILETFKGFLVLDRWSDYFKLKYVIHCPRDAHIARELTLAIEMGQKLAIAKRALIFYVYNEVDRYGGTLQFAIHILVE
jgi:hypothetical protein